MASTDARPVPRKNVAYRITFEVLDNDGDPVTSAVFDSGLASGANRALVSLDGIASVNSTNSITAIDNGFYYLDLTATETNVDTVSIRFRTTTTDAKSTGAILYPEEAGDIRVNVTQWDNGAVGTLYTEINNLFTVTTRPELTSIPGASPTLIQMISFLYEYFKHRKIISQTNGTEAIYRFNNSTVLGTATISDDGTEFTKGQQN